MSYSKAHRGCSCIIKGSKSKLCKFCIICLSFVKTYNNTAFVMVLVMIWPISSKILTIDQPKACPCASLGTNVSAKKESNFKHFQEDTFETLVTKCWSFCSGLSVLSHVINDRSAMIYIMAWHRILNESLVIATPTILVTYTFLWHTHFQFITIL